MRRAEPRTGLAGRLRLAALVLAVAAAPAPQAAAQGDVGGARHVRIGVRTDGGPFARQEPETGNFRGYLYDLCVEAVARAGYTYEMHPINAAQRVGVIAGDPTVAAPDGSTWELDLLCDPTTISLGRLEQFAEHGSEAMMFTPVMFVANTSFVEAAALKVRDPKTHRSALGCVGPESGAAYRAGFVVGATSETIVGRYAETKGVRFCLVQFPSHDLAVRALCRGDVDYYFGDLDIIRFYAEQETATRGACEIKMPQEVLSYEPYALLVSDVTAGFRPRFFAALYGLFSDGTASQRFSGHFFGATMSTALTLLFRINSVPGLREAPPGAAIRLAR